MTPFRIVAIEPGTAPSGLYEEVEALKRASGVGVLIIRSRQQMHRTARATTRLTLSI